MQQQITLFSGMFLLLGHYSLVDLAVKSAGVFFRGCLCFSEHEIHLHIRVNILILCSFILDLKFIGLRVDFVPQKSKQPISTKNTLTDSRSIIDCVERRNPFRTSKLSQCSYYFRMYAVVNHSDGLP